MEENKNIEAVNADSAGDTNSGGNEADTIQVDPIKIAEATIAFMHVDNANLNLANKKLAAENKILEIMGLARVSPLEYGYNPNTGMLERQKQKQKQK